MVTQIKSYTDTSDCTLLDNIRYCPIRPACFGYSIKPSLDIIIKIRKTSSSSVQEVKQSHYRSGQVLVEGESRRCQDNRHMKVVRLSTVSTGGLYPPPPRKYPWYSFLLEAESTPGPYRIISVKNSNDTIGNPTRDLTACSSVICTRPLLLNWDCVSILTAIIFSPYWCGWRSTCSCITTGCLTLIIKGVVTVGVNWDLRMGIRLQHNFIFTFVNVILIIDLIKLIFFCSIMSQLKSRKVLLHSLQS